MAVHFLKSFFFFFLVWFAVAAGADERADTERQLKQLRAKVIKIQKQISAQQTEKNSVERALKKLDGRVAGLGHKMAALNQDVKQYNMELARLGGEKKRVLAQLGASREALYEQIRTAYRMGQQPQLKMLLNQENPTFVSRMTVYFRYVSQAQGRVITQAQTLVDQLDSVEHELSSAAAGLKAAKVQLLAEQNELEQLREQREQVIETLARSIQQDQSALSRTQQDQRVLEKLLSELSSVLEDVPELSQESRPFKTLKGKLIRPVKGRVSVTFGSSKNRSGLRWSGILIDTPAGTSVRAVSHGQVVFAEWLRGYGYLIILDHGQEYLSLYGYNQSLEREVGDWVLPGETIALTGSSGGQKKTGLYFELRHKGKPMSPIAWITKNKGSG